MDPVDIFLEDMFGEDCEYMCVEKDLGSARDKVMYLMYKRVGYAPIRLHVRVNRGLISLRPFFRDENLFKVYIHTIEFGKDEHYKFGRRVQEAYLTNWSEAKEIAKRAFLSNQHVESALRVWKE